MNPGRATAETSTAETTAGRRVLCVDLDGTLIRTDLLFESAMAFVRENPFRVFLLFVWLLQGKAQLKRQLAQRVSIDPAALPWCEEMLAHLREEQAKGTHLVLATAADEKLAHAVAGHVGLFAEVLASDGRVNLASHRKLERLVERYGAGGFHYAGNDTVDLVIWEKACGVVVVGATGGLLSRVKRKHPEAVVLGPRKPLLPTIAKALRLHQWVKNLLVLLPIFTAHKILDGDAMLRGLATFVAFGLCASSVYLLNDLSDLEADRLHRTKRNRPLAAGHLSIPLAAAMMPLLLGAGLLLAGLIATPLLVLLACYLAVNLGYTFKLKRLVVVDVIALAGLYTLRIFAGSAGTGIPVSPWLLAFSMFFFLSLALVKRGSELFVLKQQGAEKIKGRGYLVGDLDLVRSLGSSSGYLAVLVLALYIQSEDVRSLYANPQWLWLICPLVLFWISRVWLLAHRGELHDDPVVFAVRDRVSHAVGLIALALLFVAT